VLDHSGVREELVGRDGELRRIEEALDAVDAGPQALVLEGPPGIGKTAVWRAGVARAHSRGLRILGARPAEAEATLAFSSLGDLLQDSLDAIGELPHPRRHALRVALFLEDPDDSPLDRRALSVALLALLRELVRDGPVMIAVDDLQWLDPPTAGALTYALRRLDAERVVFLGAARPEAGSLQVDHLQRVVVGPLDLSALDRIIRRALGAQLPRPVLRRLDAVSAGNPFYALELARALTRRAQPFPAFESLPLPETLADAVGERIASLPDDAREALLITAALSSPTLRLVTAAAGGSEGMRRGAEASVLVIEGDRVRLDHPLLGSVAYAAEPPERRRALHRRLAAIVTGEEERARHLANAADGPDESVAESLEAAARSARARGASESAANLAELAVGLTPATAREEDVRRRALAGDCHFAAGDARRAEALLDEVVSRMPNGAVRARVLWRLAAVKAAVSGPPEAYPLYRQALEEGEDDVRLCAQIHDRLATWTWIGAGAVAAQPHAKALVKLAERDGEPGLLARAIGAELALEVARGRPLDRARYDRMLALERDAPEQGVELPGSALHHQLLTWAGEYDESRRRIAEFLERARERSEASQILPLWCLACVDVLTANWERGLASVAAALELVEQTGRRALVPGHLSLRAIARAHIGDVEGTLADAQAAISLAEQSGQEIQVLLTRVAVALLDLSRGDARNAHATYVDVADAIERRGEGGLGVWWLPDEIEARVAEGDVDGAAARLAPFREAAVGASLPRFEAVSARAAAIIAFARGDETEALSEFDTALARHQRSDDAYQLGRTLLALGSVQRRLRRRAAAAETLTRAIEQLESSGASLWAKRARDEQARIGGRAAATSGLTATERQIAELVRSGRSNDEVARALSISPRTVEWNLTKIYRKLRVSSRTELAAKLAETL
jgi:DNA-binding CsgD family transcriptional regulator